MDNASVARRDRVPADLQEIVDRALARALAEEWVSRIWARDGSLWTDDPRTAALIGKRLGWLDVPAFFDDHIETLQAFGDQMRASGYTGGLVCGMGGSSLAPEVLASAMSMGENGIPVLVLDSTDPTAVRAASTASDPERTLYLIASKSGTTTETLAFLAHFWRIEDDLHTDIPASLPGEHFVAITDPGRSLAEIPHHDLFREVFLNPEDVGGRYSALTYVGLVPAALMGHNLRALLGDAAEMAGRTAVTDQSNPGLALGVTMGALAGAGRDKLTLVIEPRSAALGSWIEQLVAESTGKRGVGIVPVVDEPLGDPGVYGADRVFVRLSTGRDAHWEAATSAALDRLAEAGHPVIELDLDTGPGALGGEFFRWEFATAVAGAVMGLNPFDEPNVTESKENTRRVLEVFRETGTLPAAEVLATDGPLSIAGDAPMRLTTGRADDMTTVLRRHLARCRPGGYIGIHAYLAHTPERDAVLRGVSQLLRDRTARAVTLGYGPRFLHSTGQLHKGGAPIGCFIQLTSDYLPDDDVPIPGSEESFAALIAAQAAGDFISLESHDLPVVNINLSSDPDEGLTRLREALEAALAEPLTNEGGMGTDLDTAAQTAVSSIS